MRGWITSTNYFVSMKEVGWAYSHPTTAQGQPKGSSNVVPQSHTSNQLITTRSFLKSSGSLSLSPWSAWSTSLHLQSSFSFSKPDIFSLTLSLPLSVSGWPLVQDEGESFGSHVMDSCPLNSLPLTKKQKSNLKRLPRARLDGMWHQLHSHLFTKRLSPITAA